MINKIVSLLARYGYNRTNYAEFMGMSKSSLGNKIKRGSWTAADLILLAEMTSTKLVIVDDTNRILVEFEKDDITKKDDH